MPTYSQIFAILFLMLGPFKIIGPFVKITQNADPFLARKIAIRATIFSSITLLLAALLGEGILTKYTIPVPILALAGGIILFLVALIGIVNQFAPAEIHEGSSVVPTLGAAMNPITFPTIVTPYGIAAVIVFFSISPDLNSKLIVGAIVLSIMLLNLVVMLLTRNIYKHLIVILPILGSIIGVVQVALGLMIIYHQLNTLLKV